MSENTLNNRPESSKDAGFDVESLKTEAVVVENDELHEEIPVLENTSEANDNLSPEKSNVVEDFEGLSKSEDAQAEAEDLLEDFRVVKEVLYNMLDYGLETFHSSMWKKSHNEAIVTFASQMKTVFLWVQNGNLAFTFDEFPDLTSISTQDNPTILLLFKKENVPLTNENVHEMTYSKTFKLRQDFTATIEETANDFIKSLATDTKWPENVKRETLFQTYKFICSFRESKNTKDSKKTLFIPDENFENQSFNNSFATASQKDLFIRLECVLSHWTRQIKGLLGEQSLLENDSTSVLEELNFWIIRKENLTSIRSQLQDQRVVRILEILASNGSQQLSTFETLSANLIKGAEQVEENQKFLCILEEPCLDIEKLTTEKIPTVFQSVFYGIRLLWDKCLFYKSQEKIASLFRKISSQIIRRCAKTINVEELFEGRIRECFTALNSSIRCLKQWKDILQKNLLMMKKGELWNFDSDSIFAQTEAFVQRCLDLKEVCEGQIQFSPKSVINKMPVFAGSKGVEIMIILDEIRDAFQKQVQKLAGSDVTKILDIKSTKWHEDYNLFKIGMKSLDNMYVNLINFAFNNVFTVQQAVEYMIGFKVLSRRDTISLQVMKKIERVNELFLKELKNIEVLYKTAPSPYLYKGRFAAKALWHNGLLQRVQDLKAMYDRLKFVETFHKDQIDIEYVRVENQLKVSINNSFKAFKENNKDLEANLPKKLDQNILVENFYKQSKDRTIKHNPLFGERPRDKNRKYIESNFDKDLHMFLLEYDTFRHTFNNGNPLFGNKLDDFAETQKEKLRVYRENVLLVVRDYNSMLDQLRDEEVNLFSEHIDAVNSSIIRGIKILRWSSQGTLDNFVKECRTKCEFVVSKITAFKQTKLDIQNKIMNSFSKIRFIIFDSKRVHEFDAFLALQQNSLKYAHEILKGMFSYIKTVLEEIYMNFIEKKEGTQKAWFEFLRSIDSSIEEEFRRCFRSNLQDLLKAITGDERSKTNPTQILKLFIVLKDNEEEKLNFEPTLAVFENSIRDALAYSVEVFNDFLRLPKLFVQIRAQKIAEIIKSLQNENQNKRNTPSNNSSARKFAGNFIELPPSLLENMEENYRLAIHEESASLHHEILKALKIQSKKIVSQLEPWRKNCSMLTGTHDYSDYTNFIMEKNVTVANLRAAVEYYDIVQSEIQVEKSSDDSVCIQIDTSKIKRKLIDLNYEEQKILLTKIKEKACDDLKSMHSKFADCELYFSTLPLDIWRLKDSLDYLANLKASKDLIEASINSLEDKFKLLDDYMIVFNDQENKMRSTIKETFEKFTNLLVRAQKELDICRNAFQNEHTKKLSELEQEVRDNRTKILKEMPTQLEIGLTSAIAFSKIDMYRNYLLEFKEKESAMDFGFELFGIAYIPIPEISMMESEISNLELFWNLKNDWDLQKVTYLNWKFLEIDTNIINEFCSTTKETVKSFPKQIQSFEVCEEFVREIELYLYNMELVNLLKGESLRERHWEIIRENAKQSFSIDEPSFTLEKIMKMNLESIAEVIKEVRECADSEFKIENIIQEIIKRWDKEEMQFEQLKFTNVKVINGGYSEKLSEFLEEDLIQLNSLKSNIHAASFSKQIEVLDLELNKVAEIMDLLMVVQKKFVYFNNIFANLNEDTGQLIGDKNVFNSVKTVLLDYLSKFEANNNTRQNLLTPKFKSTLDELCEQLETIQKHMRKYLEKRKFETPRFYFLSDEDIFEILGKAKDPLCLRKFLRKMFEGIRSLDFQTTQISKGKVVEYTHIVSAEDEKIDMINKIEVNGDLNFMIQSIENEMVDRLKSLLTSSCAYIRANQITGSKATDTLEKWLAEFPGQILLLSSQIEWTDRVRSAIIGLSEDKNYRNANAKKITAGANKDSWTVLKQYYTRYLADLITVIRKTTDPLAKKKLIALVTIEVHQKDLIETMIGSTFSSFSWLSQMRFTKTDENAESTKVVMEQGSGSFDYGFEYQGNNGRLVITPLTDRCFLTLTNALHFKRGANPQGPAGTGKTETVKDLGKNLGRFVFIFNCSEGLDATNMRDMFEGFAQTGFWGCFDEFNRIEVEVLSIIAVQINTILEAISCGKKTFYFEEKEIPLNFNCALFVTMNPGYRGRKELPDNLKSLFRPISMIVPDSVQICRITLQAEGFKSADFLSKKIESLYELMKQTLSHQTHYDFGLRSVKSVLTLAGDLRRSLSKDLEKQSKEYENMTEQRVLIQALFALNESKLITADLQIFENLLSDLFADENVTLRQEPDLSFIKRIDESLDRLNLDKIPYFVEKLCQLNVTKNSRHGNIVIGKSMSGKSTLMRALEEIQNRSQLRAKTFCINPKSVSLVELFGHYDQQSDQNTLGIFSSLLDFLCNRDESPEEKWIVFDGPIDSNWIESMNSLLDDNKVLTLLDGNRISLKDNVKLFFEVDELNQASPATISRCGVVFVDYREITPLCIKTAWILKKESEGVPDVFLDYFEDLFDKWVEPILVCKKRISQHEIIKISEKAQVRNLFKLFDGFSKKIQFDISKIGATSEQNILSLIEKVFVFCVIWSLGSSLNSQGRMIFDNVLRDVESLIPFSHTVFDYYISAEKGKFNLWEDNLTIPSHNWKPQPGSDGCFSNSLVETVDTICSRFLLNTLIDIGQGTLVVGPAGCGKSSMLLQTLNSLDDNTFSYNSVTLSMGTTSQRLQESIESKLNRTTKRKFRPPAGKKGITFVDDLALPRFDDSGYQPALELLRQAVDYNGWYDRSSLDLFVELKDLVFVAAMREGQVIPERLLNKFFVLSVTQPNENQLKRIYSSYLSYVLSDFDGEEVKSEIENTTNFLVGAFKLISTSDKMIPTPAKPHYLFSLKDITRVVQGISLIDRLNCDTKTVFLKLVVHETLRVFQDKMMDGTDKDFVKLVIEENFNLNFEKKFVESIANPSSLLFVNFLQETNCYNIVSENTDKKEYFSKLKLVLSEGLATYNKEQKIPLNIVLFEEAISYLCKISRTLNITGGNLLLIGEGGTGKHSLTKLAAFIGGFDVHEMKNSTVAAFRSGLKSIFSDVVMKPKNFVLLFGENQTKSDEIMEDINCLLSSGQIPGLFNKTDGRDEFSKIRERIKFEIKKDSDEAIYEHFTKLIQRHMHIVFCGNDNDNNFKRIIRNFTGLIYGSTQIHFDDWSYSALQEVSHKFLKNQNLSENIHVAGFFAFAHAEIKNCLKTSQQVSRSHIHITPKHFVDLGRCFNLLYEKKFAETQVNTSKYQNGLQKLEETQKSVEELKSSLDLKRIDLHKKKKECEEMLFKIDYEKRESAKEKKIIEEKEAVLSKEREATLKLADAAELQLEKALPALNDANENVKGLDNNSIAEIKVLLKTKDKRLELIMFALMVLLKEKPKWDTVQKVVTDPNFLKRIKDIEKDKIEEERVQKLEQYTQQPEIQTNLETFSRAVNTLAVFVKAIELYAKINLDVNPIRNNVLKLKKTLASKEEELAELKNNLDITLSRLSELNNLYDNLNNEYQQFLKEFSQLEQRLDRAEKLVIGLSSSFEAWVNHLKFYNNYREKLEGSSLISSCFLIYFGVLSAPLRAKILKESLIPYMIKNNIPLSHDFNSTSFLGSEVEMLKWNFAGLPNDINSLENALIVKNALNWPFIIDPQNQCLNWIKNMEQPSKCFVINGQSQRIQQIVEEAIIEGNTIIYQFSGEKLHSVIGHVLQRVVKTLINSKKIFLLGEKELSMNEDFRFYMLTKTGKKALDPEAAAQVTVIDFTVTEKGLEEQLMSSILNVLDEKVEVQRIECIKTKSQCDLTLRDLENRILEMLQNNQDVPLVDCIELIDTLQTSKEKEEEVKNTLEMTKINFRKVMSLRENYRYLGNVTSLIFFTISQFDQINNAYQFSLESFTAHFQSTLVKIQEKKHDFSDSLIDRIKKIDILFRKKIYKIFNESLFEKDRLLFSLSMAVALEPIDQKNNNGSKIEESRKRYQKTASRVTTEQSELEQNNAKSKEQEFMIEYEFLTKPSQIGNRDVQEPNPDPSWLSPSIWDAIHDLNGLSNFQGILGSFLHNTKEWKKFFLSAVPELEVLPSDWSQKIRGISLLLLVKAVRPDRLTFACSNFVKQTLGQFFISSTSFDLNRVCKRINKTKQIVPILILLGSGVDPWPYIEQSAHSQNTIVHQISIGQNQLDKIKQKIIAGIKEGFWIYIGNIHLSLVFIKELSGIIDGLRGQDKKNSSFKLFLSSKPDECLTSNILQNSYKVVLEPIKGLKTNMNRIISNFVPDFKPTEERGALTEFSVYKKLVFSLAWFHSELNERKRFLSLGWNVPYEFSDTDFTYSEKMLREFVSTMNKDSNEVDLQWDAIRFLVGQINYGGRITDQWDQRLLNELTQKIFNESMINNKNFKLGDLEKDDQRYKFPNDAEETALLARGRNTASNLTAAFSNLNTNLLDIVKNFPDIESPYVFGQNLNSEITIRVKDSNNLLDSLLSLSSARASNSYKTSDMDLKLLSYIETVIAKIPAIISTDLSSKSKPRNNEGQPQQLDPFLIFFTQESQKLNALIKLMTEDLSTVVACINGKLLPTEETDKLSTNLREFKVPAKWSSFYLSIMPFSHWLGDLKKRVEQVQDWFLKDEPATNWLGGFVYPNGFLTAVLQRSARKFNLPIDALKWEFQFMAHDAVINAPPRDGVYIRGLFVENGKWNWSENKLSEADPMTLHSPLPVVLFKPVDKQNKNASKQPIYNCPCYIYPVRESSVERPSFLFSINLPFSTKDDTTESFWIKRGTAVLLALDRVIE